MAGILCGHVGWLQVMTLSLPPSERYAVEIDLQMERTLLCFYQGPDEPRAICRPAHDGIRGVDVEDRLASTIMQSLAWPKSQQVCPPDAMSREPPALRCFKLVHPPPPPQMGTGVALELAPRRSNVCDSGCCHFCASTGIVSDRKQAFPLGISLLIDFPLRSFTRLSDVSPPLIRRLIHRYSYMRSQVSCK